MTDNHVVYQILDDKDEVLYIGSGTRERPEVSRKYSHIPELRSLRDNTRVELLYQGLSKKESLEKEAKLLRKLCPRLNNLIPRLSKGQHGVVSSHVEFRGSVFESFHSFLTHTSETHPKITRRFATTDLDETINEYFILLHRGTEYFFEFKNEGARGQGLHSWYKSKEGSLLPHEQVELPFVVLVNALSSLTSYPGKSALRKALENHDVYWRRIDFTTYTLPFSTEARKQSCLEMLAFMATTHTVWGFDPTAPGTSKEMGLQKFAGAKVNVYKKTVDGVDVYGTVAFTKVDYERALFRLSIYDKRKEVEVCGDENNQAVVGNTSEIDLRLRMELQLMPDAFRRMSALRAVADTYERTDFAQTKFLHDTFRENFETTACDLLIESMKSLKLDWILLPRDPDLLLNRVEQVLEDPETSQDDGDVAQVLKTWKENRGPLPGSDRVTEAAHPLFGKIPRARAARAYAAIQQQCGLDVVKMGYDEISFLWNLLIEAHMPYDDRLKLEEAKRRLAAGSFDQDEFARMSQRLYRAARRLALESRKDYRQVLGQGQIQLNLSEARP